MGYARPFELKAGTPVVPAEAVRAATDKLLGLELLRFLSAMAVLFWHYSHFGQMAGMAPIRSGAQPLHVPFALFYDYGLYGVQIFWGISGYIFFWKYGAAVHARTVTARDFFWLRFSRLYPLHLATLFLVIALQAIHRHLTGGNFVYPTDDPGLFVRQLFLATDWGPQPPFSFNGPIWSVSAEVAVYAAFFLALRRFRPTIALCLSAIIAGLVLQLAGLNWAAPFCATYFFAGGLAALTRPKWTAAAIGALGLIVVLFSLTGMLADRDKLPMFLLLAVPCLLAVLGREWPILTRVERQLQSAGNLTYSSYLLHFPLQLLVAIGVAASGIMLPLASPWFLAAYLGVTFGLAALSYRWLELPAQRWIRRRTLNRAG